ncbi:MAG: GTP cyclohydrolase I FolE [Bacteroidetes bacterium]|nr:GTP cyclohydrolase I FolE [Bacteroidota bacterium]
MSDLPSNSEEAQQALEAHFHEVLTLLGEDPAREGLVKTPERIAKSLSFLTEGYAMDARAILRSAIFEEEYNEMILVRDIDVFSLCEHHMLPFIGKAHVAYIARNHIVGLSKIPRVVDVYARRLQVQERMTFQIRDAIDEVLQPDGTAVVVEATHLCMSMRGVQKQNAVTATSAMSGVFLTEGTARAELMRLIHSPQR